MEIFSGLRLPASGSSLIRGTDLFLPGKLLFNNYESLADFVQQRIKLSAQDGFLRVNNYVDVCSGPRSSNPHGFA